MATHLKSIYQKSLDLSDVVWTLIQYWSNFNKTIIGTHYINCLDFLSIHLAKALTNKSKKQKTENLRVSLEYLKEALLWHDKSRRRKLINQKDYKHIYENLKQIKQKLEKSFNK